MLSLCIFDTDGLIESPSFKKDIVKIPQLGGIDIICPTSRLLFPVMLVSEAVIFFFNITWRYFYFTANLISNFFQCCSTSVSIPIGITSSIP